MALWNKLKDELGRAGRAAQEAIDEGKLRLDLLRSRQAMDRAAQKLGYAAYRARKSGGDIAQDEYRSEEHTSELQSLRHLVCRLLLEKKKTSTTTSRTER